MMMVGIGVELAGWAAVGGKCARSDLGGTFPAPIWLAALVWVAH